MANVHSEPQSISRFDRSLLDPRSQPRSSLFTEDTTRQDVHSTRVSASVTPTNTPSFRLPDSRPIFQTQATELYRQPRHDNQQQMGRNRVTPRLRAPIACVYCRRRKIRCSGFNHSASSRCTNCVRYHQECLFTPTTSPGRALVPAQTAFQGLHPMLTMPEPNSHPAFYFEPGTQLYGAFGQPFNLSSLAGLPANIYAATSPTTESSTSTDDLVGTSTPGSAVFGSSTSSSSVCVDSRKRPRQDSQSLILPPLMRTRYISDTMRAEPDTQHETTPVAPRAPDSHESQAIPSGSPTSDSVNKHTQGHCHWLESSYKTHGAREQSIRAENMDPMALKHIMTPGGTTRYSDTVFLGETRRA